MDIALLILELVIALGLAYLFSQFKELPKQIHEYSMKEFEHDLSKKLEAFKKELMAELEEFKPAGQSCKSANRKSSQSSSFHS